MFTFGAETGTSPGPGADNSESRWYAWCYRREEQPVARKDVEERPIDLECWDPRVGHDFTITSRRFLRRRQILQLGSLGWLVLCRRGGLGRESIVAGAALQLLLERMTWAYACPHLLLQISGCSSIKPTAGTIPDGWRLLRAERHALFWVVPADRICGFGHFYERWSRHDQTWCCSLGEDVTINPKDLREKDVDVTTFTGSERTWKVLLVIDNELGTLACFLPIGPECDGLLARLGSDPLINVHPPSLDSHGQENVSG